MIADVAEIIQKSLIKSDVSKLGPIKEELMKQVFYKTWNVSCRWWVKVLKFGWKYWKENNCLGEILINPPDNDMIIKVLNPFLVKTVVKYNTFSSVNRNLKYFLGQRRRWLAKTEINCCKVKMWCRCNRWWHFEMEWRYCKWLCKWKKKWY